MYCIKNLRSILTTSTNTNKNTRAQTSILILMGLGIVVHNKIVLIVFKGDTSSSKIIKILLIFLS